MKILKRSHITFCISQGTSVMHGMTFNQKIWSNKGNSTVQGFVRRELPFHTHKSYARAQRASQTVPLRGIKFNL